MFEQFSSLLQSFLSAPLLLASGSISVLTVIPAVGLLLLVIGVPLAILWREKQAVWLLPPLVASLLAPVALGIADGMMGWFGMLFALVIGGIGLLVWVLIVAGNATRRLPVALAGLSLLAFPIYCGIVNIALTWGVR